jgi:hypothetical protein
MTYMQNLLIKKIVKIKMELKFNKVYFLIIKIKQYDF